MTPTPTNTPARELYHAGRMLADCLVCEARGLPRGHEQIRRALERFNEASQAVADEHGWEHPGGYTLLGPPETCGECGHPGDPDHWNFNAKCDACWHRLIGRAR